MHIVVICAASTREVVTSIKNLFGTNGKRPITYSPLPGSVSPVVTVALDMF